MAPSAYGTVEMPPSKEVSRLTRLRSSPRFVVAVVSLSFFSDMFLYGIIVPVLPTALMSRAKVSHDDAEYWVSLLLMCEAATSLLFSPIFGYMVDRSARRKAPYLCGLVLLAGSMACLTAARTIPLYIVGRLLQGAATALVSVTGLALVVDSVEHENLGQMIGYVGSAVSAGFALGPLLGGVVYHAGGYYAVFAMAFGIIGIDMALRLAMFEPKPSGYALLTAEAEEEPEDESEDESQQPRNQRESNGTARHAGGLLQLKKPPNNTSSVLVLLKEPRFLAALWAVVVQGIVASAFDATLPLFVERTFQWDSLGAGLVFLPSVVPALLEPFYGYLSDRFGERIITVTSFALAAPPLALLRLVAVNSLEQKVLLCALLALVGFSSDLSTPALAVELESVLAAKERESPGIFGEKGVVAQSFGLYDMASSAGILLGPILGGLVNNGLGWKAMTMVLALLAGLTLFPAAWIGDRWPWEKKRVFVNGIERSTSSVA